MAGKKKIYCEKCGEDRPITEITPHMWRGSFKWICYSCWPQDKKGKE